MAIKPPTITQYRSPSSIPAEPKIHKPLPSRLNPEWANLPRRKCDNCGASYKPGRPLRATDRYGFCKPDCKKSFHKNGGAYRKLKAELEKLIEKRLREVVRDEIDRARIASMVPPILPRTATATGRKGIQD